MRCDSSGVADKSITVSNTSTQLLNNTTFYIIIIIIIIIIIVINLIPQGLGQRPVPVQNFNF
jgi:t-SNARE complex subunit (syntaxin)